MRFNGPHPPPHPATGKAGNFDPAARHHLCHEFQDEQIRARLDDQTLAVVTDAEGAAVLACNHHRYLFDKMRVTPLSC